MSRRILCCASAPDATAAQAVIDEISTGTVAGKTVTSTTWAAQTEIGSAPWVAVCGPLVTVRAAFETLLEQSAWQPSLSETYEYPGSGTSSDPDSAEADSYSFIASALCAETRHYPA